MKKFIHNLLAKRGLKLIPNASGVATDMDPAFRPLFETSKAYTMTSPNSMYALFEAVKYVHEAQIPGDIVECGVWKGGSAMIAAKTLSSLGSTSRKLYLYDTFEGMPEPGDEDVKIRTGIAGKETWKEKQETGGWARAGLVEVQKNMSTTAYPQENIVFVEGMVEDTIPDTIPEQISILRLDTDWFASTYHELTHLFPRLSSGGVLIIDDYGSWAGSKKATDQYFKENNIHMLLQRVDTGRVGVKMPQ